jgi:hypothetical protein
LERLYDITNLYNSMELVVSRHSFQREVNHEKIEDDIKPEGLLNSNYQNIVKDNYTSIKEESVFVIRQRIKSFQYANSTSISTILKISVFLIVYIVITQ